MSIPKTIHYCWFGGNPLPKLAKKCIESWKKYCPDYEIIEWNESNFDINCNTYVKEAYEAKKWAFVTDYARFEILYKYGGVYLDTDVEIIKPLDDILSKGPLIGCETDGKCDIEEQVQNDDACKIRVAPGLIVAANAGMGLMKAIIDDYDDDHFKCSDGTYNTRTVVLRVTDILLKNGLKDINKVQYVSGLYIYPKEYFCPKDFISGKIKKTKNTVCIHHFDSSWFDERQKKKLKNKRREFKIYQIKHIPNRMLIKLLGDDKYTRIKKLFGRG